MTNYTVISHCRACGSNAMEKFLDLGLHPLANAFKKNQFDDENKYPLSLSFCKSCSLVQLNETVSKEILFSHYLWVTGTAQGTQNYATQFAHYLKSQHWLKPDDLILEIASNDGTFLKAIQSCGFNHVLGVDPAANIAQQAQDKGIPTDIAYWNGETAERILGKEGKVKCIIARNVIPHVSELSEVIRGIQIALDPEGVGVIEFHSAQSIWQDLQYDSIYHEHLSYFSLKSLTQLLASYGLQSFHITPSPISGGSWVLYFSLEKRPVSEEFELALKNEKPLETLCAWTAFAEKVQAHQKQVMELLESDSNQRVLAFGASARSTTLLNACGANETHLNAIIDNNVLKQGLWAPGSCLPIISFDEGMQCSADKILLLAWNFKDEIIQQCEAYGFRGEFVIPFPNKPYVRGVKHALSRT